MNKIGVFSIVIFLTLALVFSGCTTTGLAKGGKVKCGDGRCGAGEDVTCPEDCEPAPCGDGICAAGEDVTCPEDCACGDNICEGMDAGEDCNSCPNDCPKIFGPSGGSCDNCWKGVCDGSCNSRKEDSSCSDCAQGEEIGCCGDGVCSSGEDDCAIDCACSPSTETCDGMDNDCDGAVDEGSLCGDANPCTDDVCSGGGCTHTFNSDPCNDDLFCTTSDTCSVGLCVGTATTCNDADPCTVDICDESIDSCVYNFTCECLTDADCDDANPCTTETCVAGSCSSSNNDMPCDDGLWCTVNDQCSGGSCVSSSRICDDGIGCTLDVCNEDTDSCSFSNVYCQCTTDAECDDNDPCTDDSCEDLMCSYSFNSNPCSDNLWCTINDQCNEGSCVGDGRTCDDGLACSVDSCSESIDSCVYDTSGCTQPDSCDDSDGGWVTNVTGTVTGYEDGTPYSYTDYCPNVTSVMEYTCPGQGDQWSVDAAGCTYSCAGGVCI